MKETHIEIKTDQKEVVIREGNAEILIEKKPFKLSGIIDSPLQFIAKRKDVFDRLRSNILVDREGLTITLTINEDDGMKSIITGNLTLTEEFTGFGINSGKGWVPRELGEFIKMNRVCFESKDAANKLVSILMDVKIRIDKAVENSSGQQGKIRQLKEQTLKECNIPESLTVNMPIFKGSSKSAFQCEIWINPDDLSVKLISPDAADIIRRVRDEEINNVIEQIKSECNDIVIIES